MPSLIDLANPTRFLAVSGRVLPWLAGLRRCLFAIGLYLALFVAPADYQQGDSVRIMYIHVPAAVLAMGCYALMAVAALGVLVWRHPLADVAAKSAAPLGAAFTFLGLVTGSIWGKPMWGAWWVWDARLTSFLVLFIMYLGLIALWRAFEDPSRGRPRGGDPDPGRLDQHPDHQVLGRMVEHAASAGEHPAAGRPEHRSVHALAAPRHARRLRASSLLHCSSPPCAPRFFAAASARPSSWPHGPRLSGSPLPLWERVRAERAGEGFDAALG